MYIFKKKLWGGNVVSVSIEKKFTLISTSCNAIIPIKIEIYNSSKIAIIAIKKMIGIITAI